MTTFHLTVVTPDGCAFEGQAERVVCRAIDGDLAILAKHGDYCTALGMGEAHIVDADGQRRRAACMGGMLSVLDGEVRLVATTWEWAEADRPRPRRGCQKARRRDSGPARDLDTPRVRDGTGPPQARAGAYLHQELTSWNEKTGVPVRDSGFSVRSEQLFEQHICLLDEAADVVGQHLDGGGVLAAVGHDDVGVALAGLDERPRAWA